MDREGACRGIAVALLGLASAIGGCGNDGGRPPDAAEQRKGVEDALRSLQRSLDAGDRSAVCARMDATARRQAGLVAHGRPGACVADLGEALQVIDSGGGLRGAKAPRIVTTAVRGGRATATVALDGHGRVDVPLVRGPSGWRLGTFFGTRPRAAVAMAEAAATTPFPGSGSGVAVNDGSGLRCFPLFDEGYPRVEGGCQLGGSTARLAVSIGTAFGHFDFGDCKLSYRVLTDAKGRAWTDSFELSGAGNVNNGCADIRACEGAGGEPLPWKGRISAVAGEGYFLHRMGVCLDTCIGFYAGPLTLRLSKDHRGWHARAENAGVGDSGLRFDGRIEMAPDKMDLAARIGSLP